MRVTGGREVFKLERSNKRTEAGSNLNNRSGHAIPISALLLLVVLVSAGSGVYAGASFFPLQSPATVTTTIYTTTTSWTTSTLWSTVTEVVQGVLTTVEYTTSTSTVTVTAGTSTSASTSTSAKTGTRIVITQMIGRMGSVSISGALSDVTGKGLASMSLKILIDGAIVGTATTGSTGAFTYSGTGPYSSGTHTVTVVFDGNSIYAPSQTSSSYRT